MSIHKAKQDLNEALLREEIHWKQKSRVQWLQKGVMCSKFFMASTAIRRRRNYIQCIKKSDDGAWTRDQKEIAEVFIENYKELFGQNATTMIPPSTSILEPCISAQDCCDLSAIPSVEEISTALNEMGHDKAPGPDGLPPSFYSHYWDTGLEQGEPLSPSLFIIAAETLSRLFLQMESKGLLKGFKMGRHCMPVNHLMFADDIILFGQATLKEAKAFMDCLKKYCSWSSQSINLQKSSVTFTRGVPRARTHAISQFLGMKRMSTNASYLGWKAKLLSSVGKSCLIRSVGSAISNYVVSSDVIPISIAKKIDKALRDFWWGDLDGRHSMHTTAWEVLCHPKVCGGLGFHTTEAINLAFLMKWAWKALTENSSLWSRVLNDKYIKDHDFLDLHVRGSDSILWKAILNSRSLLTKGVCRKINNGNATSIWFHPWVPNGVLQPHPCLDATEGVSLVSYFIRKNQWQEDLIKRWFNHDDAKRILNITLPSIPSADSWMWLPDHSGHFSIKSAYRVVKNVDALDSNNAKWRIIWGSHIHNRLKMLWWKILSNNLLTRSKLLSMFYIRDTECPMCSLVVEDSLHLFWNCHFARALWFGCV
uniref:Reverse transcriptase domain-containing protein n=1 Tax=Cannabis sativa TaxID=3483 RepID=A0A803NJP2_CANSA